jgi:hypothetical protein
VKFAVLKVGSEEGRDVVLFLVTKRGDAVFFRQLIT